MSIQIKLLPALVMLIAGALTSIITYLIGYNTKTALIILLLVLVVFYIIGLLLQKVIYKFESVNEAKRRAEAEEAARIAAEEEAARKLAAKEGNVIQKDEREIAARRERGIGENSSQNNELQESDS